MKFVKFNEKIIQVGVRVREGERLEISHPIDGLSFHDIRLSWIPDQRRIIWRSAGHDRWNTIFASTMDSVWVGHDDVIARIRRVDTPDAFKHSSRCEHPSVIHDGEVRISFQPVQIVFFRPFILEPWWAIFFVDTSMEPVWFASNGADVGVVRSHCMWLVSKCAPVCRATSSRQAVIKTLSRALLVSHSIVDLCAGLGVDIADELSAMSSDS